MTNTPLSYGYVSLGDLLPDPATGKMQPEPEKFRDLVRIGILAEELGFGAYHVGEHHFSDFALSSPAIILAAVAQATRRIRLSTAATLLPHHDPVRVAEDYGTVDLLSNGRVELIGGRGVYATHYKQFGQDADDGEALLAESVALLKRLWTERNLSWEGNIRPPLDRVTIRPQPQQKPYPPIWLSASSAASVERAVKAGCPIMIPTVSAGVDNVPDMVRLFRRRWAEEGHDPAKGQVGLAVHLFVGDGPSEDIGRFWKPYQAGYLRFVMDEVRGKDFELPLTHSSMTGSQAQAVCGNPEDVAAELSRRMEAAGGVDRLLIQSDQGGMPFDRLDESLRLFANEVMPRLSEKAEKLAKATQEIDAATV